MGLLEDAWSGGLTGDEESNVISEGVTSNEDTSITNLTGDEETSVVGGGMTGDPDTSLIEYGGLAGYGYSSATGGTDPEDDPTFNSPEEQADGEGIIDGGLTNDEDTNAPGQAANVAVETVENAGNAAVGAAPWWLWAIILLAVLVLLSDYAALAATVGGD